MLNNFVEKFPIYATNNSLFTSMVQIYSCFYCTEHNNKIIYKINDNNTVVDKVYTKRCYHKLTFDSSDNCIWALSQKNSKVIYKLDLNFQEIDNIFIDIPLSIDFDMDGVYHDDFSDLLYIYNKSYILSINKFGEFVNVLKYPQKNVSYRAVCSYGQYICIACEKQSEEQKERLACYIAKYTRTGASIYKYQLENNASINNIQVSVKDCSNKILCFVTNSCGYNYYMFLENFTLHEINVYN